MKKILKVIVSLVLCVACLVQPTCSAFAASKSKTYVKEMMISYGKTADAAKKWLTDKGYTVIDYNINEGADDTVSTKRAVYLGYKTTNKAEEALTDMKLMNMTGGYSVSDYQKLLDDQKASIKVFINNFIVAFREYRENYKNGQERALAAHDMLNLLYDDDTEENLGDLFLEKIQEEYTSDQLSQMSDEELSKHADMTTILMQSNATSILAIEQLIAIATDDSGSVWTDRYMDAPTYDDMIDELVDGGMDVSAAVSALAAKYDSDAALIASKIEDYKDYLKVYTDSGISVSSSKEDIEAYQNENGTFDLSVWYTAGTQYEVLSAIENDGVSLLDAMTSDDYDIEGEDRYMLYPLVSVLTEGQRACLELLPMYQLVSIGINDDDSFRTAMKSIDLGNTDSDYISIYEGIDRSIFGSEVALTGEAYNLQNSSDKDCSTNWFDDGLSQSTKMLYVVLGVSMTATIAAYASAAAIRSESMEVGGVVANYFDDVIEDENASFIASQVGDLDNSVESLADISIDAGGDISEQMENKAVADVQQEALTAFGSTKTWTKVFTYVGIGLTAITIVIMGISLWNTYKELKAYYNTTLTPIPNYMVDQAVDENDNKVFTYYKAVLCNRLESQFTTDRTALLKAYGDINGDVGRQWVALYTTKDKDAGNPITADFVVQYGDYTIPGSRIPLSIFCNGSAENLTNKKADYTYNDAKGGIYLFYGTDTTAYAGSVFSNGTYALISGGSLAVFAAATYIAKKNIRKKKEKTDA